MTKVNIFGFGEIEAVLKRLLLLTIESSVQLHVGRYDDNLVGSMHEQMNTNAVTWCVESDKEIMQVYDDMTSELTTLMNITSNVKINVQHKMSLSTWPPNLNNPNFTLVTETCYDCLFGELNTTNRRWRNLVDRTPPTSGDGAYDTSSLLNMILLWVRIGQGNGSSTEPSILWSSITTCDLSYGGKKSPMLFTMLKEEGFKVVFKYEKVSIFYCSVKKLQSCSR
jgi:hypothetical protein